MHEEPVEGAEGTEGDDVVHEIPPLPPEVSSKEQELRELVDAGAASPEELRALADKLKEKRDYEASAWKREVKPALIQSKKRRFNLVDLRDREDRDRSGLVMGGLALLAVLLVFLFAQATSFLWLVLIPVGVLGYAWVIGQRGPEATPEAEPDPESAPDPPEASD